MFRATMCPSSGELNVFMHVWVAVLSADQTAIHTYINALSSPDDGHIVARNMYRSWNKYTKKYCTPSWLHLLLMLSELLEVCAFPASIKVINKLIDKASTVCLQCLEYSAHLFCIMVYILSEREDNNEYVLLYLSNRCTIYVNSYLFLFALLHASVFIHQQQEVYNETCSSAIRNRYFLTYIMHLLDKYSKILQNARYVNQECTNIHNNRNFIKFTLVHLHRNHGCRSALFQCGFNHKPQYI